MQIGDRVEIKDRRSILFRSRGTVKNIHPPAEPWECIRVLIATDDGRKCAVAPQQVRIG